MESPHPEEVSKKASSNAADAETKEPNKLKNRVTCMFIHAVFAAAVGSGFQHGYNTAVLNAPQAVVSSWMNETLQTTEPKLTMVWSVTVSIMCGGGMIGGALTGVLSNRLGRRMTLITNNGIAGIAGILMGTSKYVNLYWMLILGRFVTGINAGLNAGVAPMYLSEISPMRIRGAIGSMYQLVITISILVAQGLSIEQVLGTENEWPILLYLIIVPAVYQVIALYLAPESPKFLLEKGKEERAISASIKLCGKTEGEANIETIRHELAEERGQPKVTMKDMYKVKKFRKPLIIMCLLMAAQQMSGINAVIFYSTAIFKFANLSEKAAQLATVGVGVINVIMTIVGVFLVEMVGRKPLLGIGFGGMAIDMVVLMVCLLFVEKVMSLSYVCIVLVYLYIILFAVGAGAIPWILGSELFTTAARPLGLSVAVPTNWLFNLIVGLIFLPLKDAMGAYVFLIFITCNVLATIFFLAKIPETKNRPIEEITATFE